MSEKSILAAVGLHTSENEFSAAPEGGQVKAENCVMVGAGLISSRRGQAPQTYQPSGTPGNIWYFDTTPVANVDTNKLAYDDGSTWTNFSGTYAPPDSSLLRMQAQQAEGNLYVTTSHGIYRVDSTDTTPQRAGAPPADDIYTAEVNSTTPGYLADGSSVAYRWLVGETDANGIVHLGETSGRAVVSNSAGASRNVNLTFPPPNDATTSMFWQLYRSKQTPTTQVQGTTTVTIPPSDEMFLVYQSYFTSDEITAGYVDYTDTTPDQFLGTPLYTNGITGDTAKYQNTRPPLAKDLAWWGDRMWFANVQWPQTLALRIIGTGEGQDGYTGVRLGDTLSLGASAQFIAWTGDDYSTPPQYFYKLTTGSGDPAYDVEQTARSLVAAVNHALAATGFRAQYTSAPSDPPGMIQISRSTVEGAQFFTSLTTYPFTIAIGGLVRSANVVTVTTTEDHGLAPGDTVYINTIHTPDALFPVGSRSVDTVPSTTTFTIPWTGSDGSSTVAYYEQRTQPIPQWAWSPAPPPSYFTIAVGGLVRASNVVTATTTSSHHLIPGDVVVVQPQGATDTNFAAGTFTVATVPSTTTFTYSQSGANATSTTAYESGAQVKSTNDYAADGIAFSKASTSLAGGPESVPRIYFFRVGVKGKAILKIVPLDNYLFVFKEEGTYVVTGDNPDNFRATLYSDALHLYAPDSAVVLAGRVFALTNQGVVSMNGSGWDIASGPIEQELFQYFGPTLSTLKTYAFGVAHETDRLYSLWLPALDGATTAPYDAPQAYVYSTIANAWTTWQLGRSCGRIRVSDDALYTGSNSAAQFYVQRNTKTAADYYDDTITMTAEVGSTQPTVRVHSTAGVTAGDVLEDSNGDYFVIVSVDSATQVTTNGSPNIVGPTYGSGTVDISLCSDVSGGVNINGTAVTVAITDDPLADAIELAAQITSSLSGNVTANAVGASPGLVNMTPINAWSGAIGNTKTLTPIGAGTTVSGATFTGGVDDPIPVYVAIDNALKWRTFLMGSPADRKVVREFHAHYRLKNFYKGTFAITTDLSAAGSEKTVTDASYVVNPDLYPGMPVEPKKVRVHAMPVETARSAYLNIEWNIREAFALWTLNGLTLVGESASERSSA